MPVRGVVSGLPVTAAKQELARSLRRQMTPEEALLWKQLRANRLAGLHFRRQQVISGFVVDFYCHAAGLVVEVDGGIHLAQVDYDAQRDQSLVELGLRVADYRRGRPARPGRGAGAHQGRIGGAGRVPGRLILVPNWRW